MLLDMYIGVRVLRITQALPQRLMFENQLSCARREFRRMSLNLLVSSLYQVTTSLLAATNLRRDAEISLFQYEISAKVLAWRTFGLTAPQASFGGERW